MKILLRSVFFTQEFLLKSVQSVLKSSVLFDQLDVFFCQVFFILSQEINFAALGFFLAKTWIAGHIVAGNLFVVESEFFLHELLLLFCELIIPQ